MTQWNRWNDKPAICDIAPSAVYKFGDTDTSQNHHLEYKIDTSTTLFLSEVGLEHVRNKPDLMNATFADAIDVAHGKSPDELADFHTIHTAESAVMYACDTIDVALWHSRSPAHAMAQYVLGGYPAVGMVKGKESAEILVAPMADDDAKRLADAMSARSRKFNRHVFRDVNAAMQPIHQQRV